MPVTRRFKFLDEGDVALVERTKITIWDAAGKEVERTTTESELTADAAERGV